MLVPTQSLHVTVILEPHELAFLFPSELKDKVY